MIADSTLNFLKDLSQNNNREWFQLHKNEYQFARENILGFAALVLKSLSEIDNTIPAVLLPEDCIMRIYRDIRFSKDKTPYKTNFGIALSGKGKNFNGPGYYINIEPGKCFIGGGSWYPEAEQLKAIRQEIDYSSGEFSEIINSAGFKKTFKSLDSEHSLKTIPKGYPADHELIEYLKLKSFVATKHLADKEILNRELPSQVADIFKKLNPLIVFLRNAIS